MKEDLVYHNLATLTASPCIPFRAGERFHWNHFRTRRAPSSGSFPAMLQLRSRAGYDLRCLLIWMASFARSMIIICLP